MKWNGSWCCALLEVPEWCARARCPLDSCRGLGDVVLRKPRRYGMPPMLLLVRICGVNVCAAGQTRTEKVLHRFGVGKDGATPVGGLVEDAYGNLYGTTLKG